MISGVNNVGRSAYKGIRRLRAGAHVRMNRQIGNCRKMVEVSKGKPLLTKLAQSPITAIESAYRTASIVANGIVKEMLGIFVR